MLHRGQEHALDWSLQLSLPTRVVYRLESKPGLQSRTHVHSVPPSRDSPLLRRIWERDLRWLKVPA